MNKADPEFMKTSAVQTERPPFMRLHHLYDDGKLYATPQQICTKIGDTQQNIIMQIKIDCLHLIDSYQQEFAAAVNADVAARQQELNEAPPPKPATPKAQPFDAAKFMERRVITPSNADRERSRQVVQNVTPKPQQQRVPIKTDKILNQPFTGDQIADQYQAELTGLSCRLESMADYHTKYQYQPTRADSFTRCFPESGRFLFVCYNGHNLREAVQHLALDLALLHERKQYLEQVQYQEQGKKLTAKRFKRFQLYLGRAKVHVGRLLEAKTLKMSVFSCDLKEIVGDIVVKIELLKPDTTVKEIEKQAVYTLDQFKSVKRPGVVSSSTQTFDICNSEGNIVEIV